MSPKQKKSRPGTRPNYFYSIMGITLVLVMLGLFGLLMMHANGLFHWFKEKVEVIVEVQNDKTDEEISAFQTQLNDKPYVKSGTLSLISKEEGAEMMRKEFGEEFLKLDMPNPLFDVFTFNVKAGYQKQGEMDIIISELKEQEVVRDAYYQEGMADMIANNLKRVGWFSFAIGAILLFVTLFLIHNTIRLALYANRFLIKNMELVGASWSFISKPFLIRSLLHGLIAGLVAVIILLGLHFMAEREFPELQYILDFNMLGAMLGGLVLLGIIISVSSTWFVVNKYLKMRVDDLY
ncbi:MAG: permease-like cell division protein FtsX [Saprospiraceae bacterium]|nr:permease-like cell division protein FtsX [Saprospiraceae bacterium]